MPLFKKKRPEHTISDAPLPCHVAIIMDGNGRWAKKRFLPRSAGHSAGAQTLKKLCRYANKIGIKYMTVYAFSTENWSRSDEEVSALMSLLLQYLKNAETELAGDRARIRIIGDRSRFSEAIRAEMQRVETVTSTNDEMTVNLALNYGGREDILQAAKRMACDIKDGTLAPENITETQFGSYLYTADMPDPDLIIRTSGELRLSNFLLWQSAYSEFYATDTLWPDFNEKLFDEAILAYQSRSRRFGGRSE